MQNQPVVRAAKRCQEGKKHAFTLIELLVVVAIIAILISILLPSLNQVREQARAAKCGSHMSDVSKALGIFQVDNKYFPPSYVYPDQPGDSVFPLELTALSTRQVGSREYGYQHWSYFLYSSGKVKDDVFQCPTIPNGGHPRTNPGPDPSDWEGGQVDDSGGVVPTSYQPSRLRDRQAKRMAFTGNAAIIVRNKFGNVADEGIRQNRLVNESEIKTAGDTILFTEFGNNWRRAAVPSGSGALSKSHRPINPFFHVASGYNEYATPNPGFRYAQTGDPTYGLVKEDQLVNLEDFWENSNINEANAVGRHHAGRDKFGGTANFMYVDGHVERKFILQTYQDREWGDKYYGLTMGGTDILDRFGQINNP